MMQVMNSWTYGHIVGVKSYEVYIFSEFPRISSKVRKRQASSGS